MPAPETMLDLYLHLACASDAEGRPMQRDKFLILAAEIAQGAGYGGIAEQCRNRVLEHNPNHMLKYFSSMREALGSDEIRNYTRQLFRLYPFERAEHLLSNYRASGYSGHHGFPDLNPAGGSTSPPPIGPKRRQRPPPTEIHTDRSHARGPSPRPEIQRAFAELDRRHRRAKRRAKRSARSAATDLRDASNARHAKLWSWTVGAFLTGLLAGSGLTAAWISLGR